MLADVSGTFKEETLCKQYIAYFNNEMQHECISAANAYGLKVKGHGNDPEFQTLVRSKQLQIEELMEKRKF